MKNECDIRQLRDKCFNAKLFSPETLDWVTQEKLWNLWVPKAYGGLEKSLTEGLHTLQWLARIDGSLGWTITLCSGANYFIGNLQENAAQEIFLKSGNPVCLGGSGGVFGTAEKHGNRYKIYGKWKYATGAPYLSHFTLNAKITQNGKELKKEDGSPQVRSFVLPKEKVQIIEDWDTMGLVASATHSFVVDEVWTDEQYSFLYNQFQQQQPIFKIDFSIFAYLTLWVNYTGMAEHFLEEARMVLPAEKLNGLMKGISKANEQVFSFSEAIEKEINTVQPHFTEKYGEEIHHKGSSSIRQLSRAMVEIYPFLGVKASRKSHPLNQIFRDYFTATQHHIFV